MAIFKHHASRVCPNRWRSSSYTSDISNAQVVSSVKLGGIQVENPGIAMNTLGLPFLLFLATAAATLSMGSAQTCNACNCQFNNVQVLSQLIDAQVNKILSDEPCKLVTVIQIIIKSFDLIITCRCENGES